MPTVTAQGKTIACETGANLRQVLLAHGVDIYNGQSKVINCRALGTCGTCEQDYASTSMASSISDLVPAKLPP